MKCYVGGTITHAYRQTFVKALNCMIQNDAMSYFLQRDLVVITKLIKSAIAFLVLNFDMPVSNNKKDIRVPKQFSCHKNNRSKVEETLNWLVGIWRFPML